MMQFNTHEVFKQLVETGMKDKTAEKLVEVINQLRLTDFENLVTKQDLKIEISGVKEELRKEIFGVKSELKEEIGEVKRDVYLLKWMNGVSIALSIAILVKLFLH